MSRRPLHFHLGLDHTGHRHRRLRDSAEIRRAREQRLLHPIMVVVACGATQPRWRNGLQRRRWLILSQQVRGDRRCFLMTLRLPPLVSPIIPF